MPHAPKPFFRTARNAWYAQVNGKQLRLAAGPETAETHKAAWDAFHALMAGGGVKSALPAATPSSGPSVAFVLDRYLAWVQAERSPRTYEWTLWHAQSFCDALKANPLTHPAVLPAAALKPHHLISWSQARPTWGANQRRGAVSCVQRAFAWAARLGHLDRDPVAGTQKPAPERREHHTTPEAFAALLACLPADDPFRDLLEFLWETGCRPLEARQLEPRHYAGDRRLFALPPAEAKGKRKWRLVRLTDRAVEIVTRRLVGCSTHVFENANGNPWTGDAVNCRFQRLKRAGKTTEFSYGLRHGFCVRKLTAGVDHLTVAELMGHTSGQMVSTVYSHWGTAEEHLRRAIEEGRTPDGLPPH